MIRVGLVGNLCRLWRVTFFPIIGKDEEGKETKVGRWMCYVTAKNMMSVYDVIERCLPEIAKEGTVEPQEEIVVPPGNCVWSVSIGMPGTQISRVVTADSIDGAYPALVATIEAEDEMKESAAMAEGKKPADSGLMRFVEEGVYLSRRIDMDKEGVW